MWNLFSGWGNLWMHCLLQWTGSCHHTWFWYRVYIVLYSKYGLRCPATEVQGKWWDLLLDGLDICSFGNEIIIHLSRVITFCFYAIYEIVLCLKIQKLLPRDHVRVIDK
jgi:hypothetical protein